MLLGASHRRTTSRSAQPSPPPAREPLCPLASTDCARAAPEQHLARLISKKVVSREDGYVWDARVAHKIRKYIDSTFAKNFVWTRADEDAGS